MIDWCNPYKVLNSSWVKGNLHAHTAPQSPCGRVPLKRVIQLYEKAGFDFLSISDHQQYTPITIPTELLLLPGIEWNSRRQDQNRLIVNYEDHLGIYSLNPERLVSSVDHHEQSTLLETLATPDVLVVANHPNWLVPHHYTEEDLFSLASKVDGIEIYNAVIERHHGLPDATMKWDRILTEKGPTLGFASDDSHLEEDIGKAFLMVNVDKAKIDSIYHSINMGRFYCSTGVAIQDLGRKDDELFCTSDQDAIIEAIGENGQRFASASGELRINFSDVKSSYIRFTLYGQGKQQAWTQPFFRSAEWS